MSSSSKEWPTRYAAAEVEKKIYRLWQQNNCFSAAEDSSRESYVIVIPPPNVTGILTMGHVLNNTLQDILIRWQRMKGKEALWVPGTDHAGIATQNVVEKSLRKEGLQRHDLGREKFVEKVWDWKKSYGGTIIRQLKELGCSCDWARERFTLDQGLSRAVSEVFVRLYRKGLIYRGPYLINWCPRCHTALSDEEVEHQDQKGKLWHLRYPLVDRDETITVATTRPETMLGDSAVAVNPTDERFSNLIGKKVRLPFVDREIPIIADEFVDPDFGTGLVKVTPAHDPNDFEMGLRHKLPQIVVMDTSGKMNEKAGPFQGLDRFEAREKIVAELESQGLLAGIEDHDHAVGQCYRCATAVEPYLSVQWFVKMKPLAEPALKAVMDGQIKFYPERWIKVYQHWMENIRDWCISRQLWWGHRIPAWYRGDEIFVGLEAPEGEGWTQEEDVLDTWFSSWLWPFSTLGWPDETPELAAFYPTSTLVTGPDIIFFWVARMIMAGLEFKGQIPFREVYYTGIIRDTKGRKMSKSLGNSPDPLDVIEEYGADALRFTIARLSPIGQDVHYSNKMCELGRNFANKIWNASRFVMTTIGSDSLIDPGKLAPEGLNERAILSILEQVVSEVENHLNNFHFNDAALVIYDFFWHQFCDRYLETTKISLAQAKGDQAALIRGTLRRVLERILALLHPIMPFISEEIWGIINPGSLLITSSWPQVESSFIDLEVENLFEFQFLILSALRNLRAEYGILPSHPLKFYLVPDNLQQGEFLKQQAHSLGALMRNCQVIVDADWQPPKTMPSALVQGCGIYMPLEGVVDIQQEHQRFSRRLNKVEGEQKSIACRLENPDFIARAPEAVKEKTRQRQEELQEEIVRLKNILAGLV